jgi:rRNA maturation endonuclease Nob1
VRKVLQLDVERLIDAYEIEVTCHSCRTVYPRAIGWLRVQPSMECPNCQATIVLRTSVMNEEMRRIGRQLRKLEQQLAQMIERAVGILGQ